MFVNANKFCGCWLKKFWSIRKALPFATPSRSLKHKRVPLRADHQRPNPYLLLFFDQVIFCVRGVTSPLLSNLYLNEVDRMLEKAVHTTRRGKSTNVQYARFADDMVILIDAERRSDWLVKAVDRRLREEFAKLRVAINEDKSRMVDLSKEESFTFLGFQYRRILSLRRKWRPHYSAKLKKRNAPVVKPRGDFPQQGSPAL